MEPLVARDPASETATAADSAEPMAEELALVRKMLEGDRTAFDEFAERYFAGIYRFALSRLRGDQDLALDMAQTTVCKAIEKLDSYRGEAPLFGWLCACCRNEIGMFFRKKQRQPVAIELDEEIRDYEIGRQGDDLIGAEQGMLRDEDADLVHLTLDTLPTHYAQALEWKYTEKLSVKTIAVRLEVSAKAAESLLTRARLAFRSRHQELVRERAAPLPHLSTQQSTQH